VSEQAGQEADGGTPRDSDETHVVSGAPGPSGTGEQTDAGADPAAPSNDSPSDDNGASA